MNDASVPPLPRYYLSIGDGTSYGPYTLEELRGYVKEGRVRAGAMLLPEQGGEWKPVGVVLPEIGLPPVPPTGPGLFASGAMPHAGAVAGARRIRLGWAVAVMVLTLVLATCVPIGIVAFLYARKANERYACGDVVGGQSAERAYRAWMIASWVVVALSIYLTWASIQWCGNFMGDFGAR